MWKVSVNLKLLSELLLQVALCLNQLGQNNLNTNTNNNPFPCLFLRIICPESFLL